MAQKKLQRFADIKTFANVLEYPENMPGKWHDFFKNENPVILELACGRGEYTIGLAKLFPLQNFIGVDVKGNRMYIGAKKCLEENRTNAGFLRTQIERITEFFGPGEVDEIWITFPDPQLRISKAKKRLTHPRFLRLYQQILKPSGVIHLKTDSPDLYLFTKKVIELYDLTIVEDCNDVYKQPEVKEELKIKTHYESLDIARSNKIHYLKFTLPAVIKNIDDHLQEQLRNEQPA
ncbi:tRNA (guanosine(46)-N7)-methyltransferase TrmB [Ferruginibacter sp. SUN106]|uniref:tRNA (guanosine(46)-N7)-methyltransferase TrmB n=1 Tax=Ferruginibacter sp. SUN106 TaxID=2978348 RepID=UPI003D36B8BD